MFMSDCPNMCGIVKFLLVIQSYRFGGLPSFFWPFSLKFFLGPKSINATDHQFILLFSSNFSFFSSSSSLSWFVLFTMFYQLNSLLCVCILINFILNLPHLVHHSVISAIPTDLPIVTLTCQLYLIFVFQSISLLQVFKFVTTNRLVGDLYVHNFSRWPDLREFKVLY